MLTQTAAPVKTRKHLITAALLEASAATGRSLDTRGLDFSPQSTTGCQDRAYLRGQVEGLAPYQISSSLWAVPSHSHPGHAYQVSVWGSNGHRKATCNCPAGRVGHTCKHGELVRHAILRREDTAPQPATITRLEDLYN